MSLRSTNESVGFVRLFVHDFGTRPAFTRAVDLLLRMAAMLTVNRNSRQ
jgi:hypothetical protein